MVIAGSGTPPTGPAVVTGSGALTSGSGGPGAPGGGPEVVVGMALVEPGRADDGAGEPVPGYGHVAMVFVHPSHWSNGYGRHLLRAVHSLGWTRTTLWTRQSNERAQRLTPPPGTPRPATSPTSSTATRSSSSNTSPSLYPRDPQVCPRVRSPARCDGRRQRGPSQVQRGIRTPVGTWESCGEYCMTSPAAQVM